ncbi:MAG: phospholipase D family protein [Planctomycetes bacterium]|nr:phospholipase D family protein [Planctomycetota bacterium]
MAPPLLNFKALSLSHRWVAAIRDAKEVVAFSPYITTSAVTDALAEKGEECSLYTVVSVENYASGSSKLSCLKKLREAKVKIYHLDTLHAKVLLVPRTLVTVGSQNMTAGGTTNQEATVIWQDAKAAERAEKEVEVWRTAGKLVTDSVVKALESDLARLRRQHSAWKKAAKKATTNIWTEWQQEEERKKKAEEAAAATRARPHGRGFVQRYAKEVVCGKVIHQQGGWSLNNHGQNSGRPPSYCRWIVDGKVRLLTPWRWVPCFHLDTRQWGKARVCKECISFIDRSTEHLIRVTVNGSPYKVWLSCLIAEDVPNYNLRIDASTGDLQATILGRYDIFCMMIDEIRANWDSDGEDEFKPEGFQPLVDAINQNQEGVQEKLLDPLLKCEWRESSLSPSNRVDQFFRRNQMIFTGLCLVKDREVLVFSTKRKAVLEQGISQRLE